MSRFQQFSVIIKPRRSQSSFLCLSLDTFPNIVLARYRVLAEPACRRDARCSILSTCGRTFVRKGNTWVRGARLCRLSPRLECIHTTFKAFSSIDQISLMTAAARRLLVVAYGLLQTCVTIVTGKCCCFGHQISHRHWAVCYVC